MPKNLNKLLSEQKSEQNFTFGINRLAQRRLNNKKKYRGLYFYHGGKDYKVKNSQGKNVRWYVYFYYEHPTTGEMVRQPNIYTDINAKFHTKRERLKYFRWVQDELEWMLENGFSPYTQDSENNLYSTESLLDFVLEIKKKSVKATTYKDYENRVKQFKSFLKKKGLLQSPITDINKKLINQFLDKILKDTTPKNRNNSRAVLSAIFGELETRDYIERNFILGINVLKTSPERNRVYSSQKTIEIFNYLHSHDSQLLLFIKLVSYNFLRPIEVSRLKVSDIDLEEKRLYIHAKNKNVKLKIIPDLLIETLKEYISDSEKHYLLFTPNGKPGEWNCEEINRRNHFTKRYKIVKNVLELGEQYTVYSFRHTFIGHLYKELRKKFNVTETEDRLMLITGHESRSGLHNYLRNIDAEQPDDYSMLLQTKIETAF